MTYSYDTVKTIVETIINEKGADTKAHCRYFNEETNKPVCIVGHVLDRLDIKEKPEEEFEFTPSVQPRKLIELFDDEARKFLTGIQRSQDNGLSWGAAYNKWFFNGER